MHRCIPGIPVVLACLLSLAAAQQRRSIELEDFFRLEDASDSAISPDGKYVALVRTRVLKEENRLHSEIYLNPGEPNVFHSTGNKS